jgi:hypothetical protein
MGVTFVDVSSQDAVVAISTVVDEALSNGDDGDGDHEVGDSAVVGEDGES